MKQLKIVVLADEDLLKELRKRYSRLVEDLKAEFPDKELNTDFDIAQGEE